PAGRKSIEVKIPAGTTSGQRIRLRGEGIVLRVSVGPDPRFALDGRDLTTDVRIAPEEAALGAKVDVPTLTGSATVTVPAGSQSGQRLRLRGRGLPAGRSGAAGDLYVRLLIAVPKTLSDEEQGLYEKLREVSRFDPRG